MDRKNFKLGKRILILGYRHLGDTIFITPAISLIRKKFPESFIAVICGNSSKDLLLKNPNINEIIVLPNNSFLEKLKIRKKLKKYNFDTVFLFQHTFLNAIFIWSLGIKNRIGLDWKGCGIFLNYKIKYDISWHEIERYLKIANLVGREIKIENIKPEIFLGEKEEEYAKNFLFLHNIENSDFLIGVNPGSSEKWKIKRWGIDKYAQLINKLVEDYKAKILVFTGPSEENILKELEEITKVKFIPVKENNLLNLAAIIKKCNLFITNDTGPLHIAVSVGTPVIDIVGPSNPKKTGPYTKNCIIIKKDLSCSPCKKLQCEDLSCLKLITVEDVLEKVEEIKN
jgi:lipopolysaccharide heptosyltransferase II